MAAPTRDASVPNVTGGQDVALLSKFFRGLGDDNRLRLLGFILGGERSVSDCVEHLDLSQGRVSIHLACLADCGFIESRREGRWNFYRVSDPRVADLVMLARSLSADNCAPLQNCERIDDPKTSHHGRPA